MEMSFKENWPQAKERLLAYWDMAIIDRPCIAVTAPSGKPAASVTPRDAKQKWTDPEYVVESALAGFEATCYGGEALPSTTLMVGYCFAYGAPLHFADSTIWHDPTIVDWDNPPRLELNEDDWGWQQTRKVVSAMVEAGVGKFFVGQPAILVPNDMLAMLRGPGQLCMDLIERPDLVKCVLAKILEDWLYIYDELDQIIRAKMEGSTSWLSVWGPGKMSALQSDFSCMVSSAHFEEFIVPELEAGTETLDHTIYHLDGPGALHHLDRLLDLPELHAIQWTPGAGQPSGLAWLDLYKRVQAKGKGLYVGLGRDEVETALRELEPEGLFITTSCSSIAEADDLLTQAKTWCARPAG